MKLPEKIRIGGVNYDIEYAPGLDDGSQLLYGRLSYSDSTIKINTDCQKSQHMGITLWHEILHGIAGHANLEIQDEEQVVDVLAKGIYQVLEDNIGDLFDVAGGDASDTS